MTGKNVSWGVVGSFNALFRSWLKNDRFGSVYRKMLASLPSNLYRALISYFSLKQKRKIQLSFHKKKDKCLSTEWQHQDKLIEYRSHLFRYARIPSTMDQSRRKTESKRLIYQTAGSSMVSIMPYKYLKALNFCNLFSFFLHFSPRIWLLSFRNKAEMSSPKLCFVVIYAVYTICRIGTE